MSAYTHSLSIDRQGKSALIGLARLHLVRGERDEARKILADAAQHHPYDEMIQNMLVALDLPRPWESLQPATVHEPVPAGPEREPAAGDVADGAPIPTATLAEIYLKQGLVDQAVRVYQEILRLEPGNAAVASRLRELTSPPLVEEAGLATPVAAPAQGGRQPLATFERWLQALRRRRAHVQ
jgi:tetratricopeptide (TPR) repeat protein